MTDPWGFLLSVIAAGLGGIVLGLGIGLASAENKTDCEPVTKTVYAVQNATVTECK